MYTEDIVHLAKPYMVFYKDRLLDHCYLMCICDILFSTALDNDSIIKVIEHNSAVLFQWLK